MNIPEIITQSAGQIAESAIAKLKMDKIEEYQVIKIDSSQPNKYYLYNGVVQIEAFSLNDASYNVGDNVYVQMLANSDDKIILGVKSLIDQEDNTNVFRRFSDTFFNMSKFFFGEEGKEWTSGSSAPVWQVATPYPSYNATFKRYSQIYLKCKIQTDENIGDAKPNYGIKLTLITEDGDLVYTFDTKDFYGDPHKFIDGDYPQDIIFEYPQDSIVQEIRVEPFSEESNGNVTLSDINVAFGYDQKDMNESAVLYTERLEDLVFTANNKSNILHLKYIYLDEESGLYKELTDEELFDNDYEVIWYKYIEGAADWGAGNYWAILSCEGAPLQLGKANGESNKAWARILDDVYQNVDLLETDKLTNLKESFKVKIVKLSDEPGDGWKRLRSFTTNDGKTTSNLEYQTTKLEEKTINLTDYIRNRKKSSVIYNDFSKLPNTNLTDYIYLSWGDGKYTDLNTRTDGALDLRLQSEDSTFGCMIKVISGEEYTINLADNLKYKCYLYNINGEELEELVPTTDHKIVINGNDLFYYLYIVIHSEIIGTKDNVSLIAPAFEIKDNKIIEFSEGGQIVSVLAEDGELPKLSSFYITGNFADAATTYTMKYNKILGNKTGEITDPGMAIPIPYYYNSQSEDRLSKFIPTDVVADNPIPAWTKYYEATSLDSEYIELTPAAEKGEVDVSEEMVQRVMASSVDTLELTPQDSYNGVYNIYGNDRRKYVQEAGIAVEVIPSLIGKPGELPEHAQRTIWKIPRLNTMLLPSEIDETWSISGDYYVKTANTIEYTIKDIYFPGANNNTIVCEIEDNKNVVYTGHLTISFGSTNTNGTQYSLNIELYNTVTFDGQMKLTDKRDNYFYPYNYSEKNNFKEYYTQTAFENIDKSKFKNNDIIGVVDSSGSITISYKKKYVNDFITAPDDYLYYKIIILDKDGQDVTNAFKDYVTVSLLNNKTDPSQGTQYYQAVSLDGNIVGGIGRRSGGILSLQNNQQSYCGLVCEVKIPEELSGNRTVTLKTIKYFGVKIEDALYMTGPTNIIYDNLNKEPTYNKEPARLVNSNGALGNIYANVQDSGQRIFRKGANTAELTVIPWDILPSKVAEQVYEWSSKVKVMTASGIIEERSVPCLQYPLEIGNNHYQNSLLNDWDGTLKIDEGNGTISAASLVVGGKDAYNQFSGLIVGEVSKIGDTSIKETGILGFKEGVSAYSLLDNGEFSLHAPGTNGAVAISSDKGIEIYNGKIEIFKTSANSETPISIFKVSEKDNKTELLLNSGVLSLNATSYIYEDIVRYTGSIELGTNPNTSDFTGLRITGETNNREANSASQIESIQHSLILKANTGYISIGNQFNNGMVMSIDFCAKAILFNNLLQYNTEFYLTDEYDSTILLRQTSSSNKKLQILCSNKATFTGDDKKREQQYSCINFSYNTIEVRHGYMGYWKTYDAGTEGSVFSLTIGRNSQDHELQAILNDLNHILISWDNKHYRFNGFTSDSVHHMVFEEASI